MFFAAESLHRILPQRVILEMLLKGPVEIVEHLLGPPGATGGEKLVLQKWEESCKEGREAAKNANDVGIPCRNSAAKPSPSLAGLWEPSQKPVSQFRETAEA